jgi:hypothetical protein
MHCQLDTKVPENAKALEVAAVRWRAVDAQ